MTAIRRKIGGVLAVLTILAVPAVGIAQEANPDRMQALEDELKRLRESQENLKHAIDEMRLKQPTGPVADGGPVVTSSLPVAIHGTVTLRYDWTKFADQTDRIQDAKGNAILGFRNRVRLLVEAGHEDDFISGGIRLSTGQVTNPAAPFITFGDGFFYGLFFSMLASKL